MLYVVCKSLETQPRKTHGCKTRRDPFPSTQQEQERMKGISKPMNLLWLECTCALKSSKTPRSSQKRNSWTSADAVNPLQTGQHSAGCTAGGILPPFHNHQLNWAHSGMLPSDFKELLSALQVNKCSRLFFFLFKKAALIKSSWWNLLNWVCPLRLLFLTIQAWMATQWRLRRVFIKKTHENDEV